MYPLFVISSLKIIIRNNIIITSKIESTIEAKTRSNRRSIFRTIETAHNDEARTNNAGGRVQPQATIIESPEINAKIIADNSPYKIVINITQRPTGITIQIENGLAKKENLLEKVAVLYNIKNKITFHLHTANPVGRENIRRIIQKNGWREVYERTRKAN